MREPTASDLASVRQNVVAPAPKKVDRIDDRVKAERRQALEALVNQRTAAAGGAIPKRQREASAVAPLRQETEAVQSRTKPAKAKRARAAVLDSADENEPEAEADEEEEEEEGEGDGDAAGAPELDQVLVPAAVCPNPSPVYSL
jgi:hypothetical protein